MGHKKPVVYNEKWLMFIVTTIIVVSDDTLLFGTNINPAFETLKYVILIGILIALCINSLRTFDLSRVSYTSVGCGMMCTLVLLSGVINRDLRTGYFYKCIILILSCEVTKQMSLKDFAQKFEKIMFIVAAVSVVCTLIAEVNLSIFSIFPVFYNSANTSFYNMGIYMVPTSVKLLRNYGIFREPGVYQMFLMEALLFHVYYVKKIKIIHIAIFILAIILTFSTTGYIALALFLILFLIKRNEEFLDDKKKYVMVFILIVGIIYMITRTDLLSNDGMVFNKFSDTKRTTMIARSSSVFANILIWKEKPLFGSGLTLVGKMFPVLSYKLYGKAVSHNTNTLFCELATYGIIYTAFLVYGYLKLAKKMGDKIMESILILLLIFVLFCGEKLTFSPIIYILLFYGISSKKIKKLELDKEKI